jgi:hypothetical protein
MRQKEIEGFKSTGTQKKILFDFSQDTVKIANCN